MRGHGFRLEGELDRYIERLEDGREALPILLRTWPLMDSPRSRDKDEMSALKTRLEAHFDEFKKAATAAGIRVMFDPDKISSFGQYVSASAASADGQKNMRQVADDLFNIAPRNKVEVSLNKPGNVLQAALA